LPLNRVTIVSKLSVPVKGCVRYSMRAFGWIIDSNA
jgi:hypothetical protein